MPTQPNTQQLLFVKQFFDEGQTLASRDDTFSTSRAILFLDLAVEQMLQAIVASLNPAKHYQSEPKWHELWADASSCLTSLNSNLRNHGKLSNLRKDRNRVQHSGATYHFSQARGYVLPTEDMITHAFRDVYGLDFQRYNLLALISNENLRQWLQDAEQILSEGGPMFAIAACNYAHRLVIETVQAHTSGTKLRGGIGPLPRGMDVSDTARLYRVLDDLNKQLTRAIINLEEEVVAIGVGFSILEARRFRSSGSLVSVSVFQDGQMHINYKDGAVEERTEAAKFMLDYLSRFIRSVEETYVGVLKELKISVPLMDQNAVREAQNSP